MATDSLSSWIEGVRGEQVKPLIEGDQPFIRVEAGPGTGKTFGLVRRVERILRSDGLGVHGSQVLVVAFNRVIAHSLRDEIRERLRSTQFEGEFPIVSTIHSLCLQILGQDTRMLMDHERDAMLYDIRSTEPRLREKYAEFRHLDQALLDHEAGHIHDPLLADCVSKWLVRHSAKLTGDLPTDLLNSFKAGDYSEHKFKHIIADEFQDLTSAEQELLFNLLSPGGCLVALGDSRQSIYHFRGNDRQGLSKLEQLAKAAIHDVPMVECQRCPGPIVEAANDLMAGSTAAPMTVGSKADANTHVVTWPSPDEEATGMAKAIYANYKENPEDKHLVMVTRRDFGYALRDELLKISPDLPINLCFSEGLLETWAAREAFLFFSLRYAPDAPSWRAWLGYKTSPSGSDFKPTERNAGAYLRLLDELEDKVNEENLRAYALRRRAPGDGNGAANIRARIARYCALKEEFITLKQEGAKLIEAAFDPNFWVTTSMKDAETARNDLKLLEKLALSLYEEALDDASDENAAMKRAAAKMRTLIATREVSELPGETAIQVSTLWSAKGVTAHHVYAIGLCDEAIPGGYRETYRGTPNEYREEQQRLFYVSITRSKGTLVLSRPRRIKTTDAARKGLSVSPGMQGWSQLSASTFLKQIIHRLPPAVLGEHWSGCKPQ